MQLAARRSQPQVSWPALYPPRRTTSVRQVAAHRIPPFFNHAATRSSRGSDKMPENARQSLFASARSNACRRAAAALLVVMHPPSA